MKILVDTNVLIDYMVDREPYCGEAIQIVDLCIGKKVKGYVAAHAITDTFYTLRKLSSEVRKELLREVCAIFIIIGIDEAKLLKVIDNEDFDDIEDCLQAVCAEEYSLDYIVTRNVKDFNGGSVPAIAPADLLEKINT